MEKSFFIKNKKVNTTKKIALFFPRQFIKIIIVNIIFILSFSSLGKGQVFLVSADGTHAGSNVISKITLGGIVTTLAASGLSNPQGLVVEASGILADLGTGTLLNDADDGTINQFTSAGVKSTLITGLNALGFIVFPPPQESEAWALLTSGFIIGIILPFRRRSSFRSSL